MSVTTIAATGDANTYNWHLGDAILKPGPKGSFDEIAVKDPSIVFFEGKWHVFYTARSKAVYTTGYVSAKELTDLQSSPRYELAKIRGKGRYGCAPQVFYYEPQRKWYLIFQNRDSNYQPAYSTTTVISQPESWSEPKPLLRKTTPKKWIDFWVICDSTKAFLFYTQEHRGVIVRSTSLDRFPSDWSQGRVVVMGVHEAVHVYKVNGRDEFHMFYELNDRGIRSLGLASSKHIAGPWNKVADKYATADQLHYASKASAWTEMISHGELLRDGYDQRMEYSPRNCRWIIQGILKKHLKEGYDSLPWQLGIMSRLELSGETK